MSLNLINYYNVIIYPHNIGAPLQGFQFEGGGGTKRFESKGWFKSLWSR
jgi:hypothetical protein